MTLKYKGLSFQLGKVKFANFLSSNAFIWCHLKIMEGKLLLKGNWQKQSWSMWVYDAAWAWFKFTMSGKYDFICYCKNLQNHQQGLKECVTKILLLSALWQHMSEVRGNKWRALWKLCTTFEWNPYMRNSWVKKGTHTLKHTHTFWSPPSVMNIRSPWGTPHGAVKWVHCYQGNFTITMTAALWQCWVGYTAQLAIK